MVENDKFVLKCDALDCYWLPLQRITERSYKDYVELWSLPEKNKYTSFEVWRNKECIPEDNSENQTSDSTWSVPGLHHEPQTTEMYECHICNVNVPMTCVSLHQNGAKHQTYMAIANEAFERLKKHMNSTIVADVKQRTNGYCDTCCLRIDHDEFHELTENHLNAVEIDEKVKHIWDIFNDTDTIKVVDQVDKFIDEVDKVVDAVIDEVTVDNVVTKKKAKNKKQPAVHQAYGSGESIPFCVERTSDDNTLKCLVCNVHLPNNTFNVTQHISSVKHDNNFECLLSINKTLIIDRNYYCELCKFYILKSDLFAHYKSINHTNYLLPPKKTAPDTNKFIKPNKKYSEAAGGVQSKTKTTIDMNKNESTNFSAAKIINDNVTIESNVNKNPKANVQSKDNGSDLKETIYQVHTNSSNWDDNKKNVINPNEKLDKGNSSTEKQYKTDNDDVKTKVKIYCSICCTEILFIDKRAHINGKRHQKNLLRRIGKNKNVNVT